ncbi:hypothetical protein KP509_05G005800 [Ceratopteris richardii]|uniref:Protein kinase domain-containing protein n=1 Tax=Ceratopteris richardii TaxID=49495 RepID=A0A8T2UQK8_CERRI|nr:hypothetical protein KP509_05G005800 [Ceratopteris richardii]
MVMNSLDTNVLCFSFFGLGLVLLLLSLPLASCSGNLSTDAKALLDFKDYLQTGSNKPLLESWNASTTSGLCTNWTGITCSNSSSSGTQRVIAIDLGGAELSGSISLATIGLLDALQNLSLGSNHLSGELPVDLLNCTSLTELLLQNNSFSGTLPASAFLSWQHIRRVDLSFNRFSGSIPVSITNATLLQFINLQNNSFSGSIPDISLQNLSSFNVANNELEGQIPSSLSSFPPLSFAGNGGLCGKPLNESCATPQSIGSSKKKLSAGSIAGIVIGCTLAGVLILIVLLIWRRRSSSRTPSARITPTPSTGDHQLPPPLIVEPPPSSVTIEIPPAAVGEPKLVYVDSRCRDAFDIDGLCKLDAEVIGKGGLGYTYKLDLESGLIITVKTMNFEYSRDYRKRFKLLEGLAHENLVPLKAWYFFHDKKLLVYEYVHGTSLTNFLHGHPSSSLNRTVTHSPGVSMDWEKRLSVAAEVATAVAYMHERNVVHGHIQSSDVLIDLEGRARLRDYGVVLLATMLHRQSSQDSAVYAAPEVEDFSRATFAADVYSFGVLLLELLTGRVATSSDACMVARVKSTNPEEWAVMVFDLAVMKYEYIEEEMKELLRTALRCLSDSPQGRPSMAELASAIDTLRSSDLSSGCSDGGSDIG